MLDTGATLNGYFCDFDRNYALERQQRLRSVPMRNYTMQRMQQWKWPAPVFGPAIYSPPWQSRWTRKIPTLDVLVMGWGCN